MQTTILWVYFSTLEWIPTRPTARFTTVVQFRHYYCDIILQTVNVLNYMLNRRISSGTFRTGGALALRGQDTTALKIAQGSAGKKQQLLWYPVVLLLGETWLSSSVFTSNSSLDLFDLWFFLKTEDFWIPKTILCWIFVGPWIYLKASAAELDANDRRQFGCWPYHRAASVCSWCATWQTSELDGKWNSLALYQVSRDLHFSASSAWAGSPHQDLR